MIPQAQAPSAPAAADDYEAFCVGVQRLCQVDLMQYERRQMERRVRAFAARRGKPELAEYLAAVVGDASERDRFLDRLTINVSALWRNPAQWEQLARHVVPVLARQRRIDAWSAGCSYGAEVYTLAAVCRQAAPGVALGVLGSDIDARMIELARAGEFSEGDARDAPSGALERWFARTAIGWKAGPRLRALTRFEIKDLLRTTPPAEAYDLIACRNTFIYFAPEARTPLHARLADALRPGGYLMVGATERIRDAEAHGLSAVHPFIYRKS